MKRVGLITDFGTRDPYVAAMKGVIASRTEAPIVDCTHEIGPFDVWEAAFYIRAMARYWPDGTIFTVVVDPGVGTSRRIVAVDSAGQIFLAPDNGVLTFVIGIAHSVENESLFLPDGSTTFHGRDRFAPVAAALANGLSIEQLGPRAGDLIRLDYTAPTYDRRRVDGTIVSIDRFGNLITDIERSRIPFAAFALETHPSSAASRHLLPASRGEGSRGETPRPAKRGEGGRRPGEGSPITRVSTNYTGEGPFLIIGSTGCVEISVAGASAAAALQLKRGDRVTVVPA